MESVVSIKMLKVLVIGIIAFVGYAMKRHGVVDDGGPHPDVSKNATNDGLKAYMQDDYDRVRQNAEVIRAEREALERKNRS